MLWGFSPAINFFAGTDTSEDKELNVLLSETGGDARHLLKSLCDILPMKKKRTQPINIYVHEKFKENIARDILWFTLMCETGMSSRERMEMYMDLVGNCLLRDKTAHWLEGIVQELIQLVTEDDKCPSVIKDLISWDTLKFKDRDEIEDVFSSWL